MGYIGQHLTSIVTGYPGGKSGARGYDLILPNHEHAEIKTCYRVDQLGSCNACKAVVSSIENLCSSCASDNILRKDDSKWLITISNDEEFEIVLEPKYYYFVLLEYEELNNTQNRNIIASIWKVDSEAKGFGYCLIDYYLNIRAASKSKAPFNMWPYQLKFYLTKPELIYRSIIAADDTIDTKIFPTLNNSVQTELPELTTFSRTTTLTVSNLESIITRLDPTFKMKRHTKKQLLAEIETIRRNTNMRNDVLCDILAEEIYLPLITPLKDQIPTSLTDIFPELN